MLAENQANIEVRTASVSDAPILARLRYELRTRKDRNVETEEQFIQRCTAWIEQRLGNDHAWKCWIAESTEMLVGSVWVQVVEKIPNPSSEPEHYVYLTNFYVREEFRSKGIGSMLLTAVLTWAVSENTQSIILWPTDRSRPFYERHGFSESRNLMELVNAPQT